MPHSRCNCSGVMCDIWKGNNIVQQINESDVEKLLDSMRKLSVKTISFCKKCVFSLNLLTLVSMKCLPAQL